MVNNHLNKIMNYRRLKEPSFLAATTSCVLLLIMMVSHRGPSSAANNQLLGDAAALPGEFDDALSKAQSHLTKGEYVPAFDMVMVASRISPSDPRLFDLTMKFIENAKVSSNDEAIGMAEDLLDRGDSLVQFQTPSKVESSRKRLTEARQSFSKATPPQATPPQATPPQATPEITSRSPLESVRRLLAVSENKSVPVGVRSRAAEHARTSLDDALLDSALSSGEQTEMVKPEDVKELQARIDNAEKQCVQELFLQCKPRIDTWLTTSASLIKETENASEEKVPDFSEQLTTALTQGYELSQELMPYSKSGIEAGVSLSQDVERQIKLLQRNKLWLYNQQTLRIVRQIEAAEKKWTIEKKIECLSEVYEELLSPYVLRRHNELWDKIFEELPDDDKKAWAVRLRILRLNK